MVLAIVGQLGLLALVLLLASGGTALRRPAGVDGRPRLAEHVDPHADLPVVPCLPQDTLAYVGQSAGLYDRRRPGLLARLQLDDVITPVTRDPA